MSEEQKDPKRTICFERAGAMYRTTFWMDFRSEEEKKAEADAEHIRSTEQPLTSTDSSDLR